MRIEDFNAVSYKIQRRKDLIEKRDYVKVLVDDHQHLFSSMKNPGMSFTVSGSTQSNTSDMIARHVYVYDVPFDERAAKEILFSLYKVLDREIVHLEDELKELGVFA